MKIFAFADEASPLITGQIAALKRNGLCGLEIRGVDGTNISDISLEKAAEVRKQLDDVGLTIWSVGSPIGKISIKDDFEPHLEKFRHILALAKVLGAENIRLFSFYVPDEADSYRDTVIQRLREFVRIAEDTGITLCHENEKGIYGDTVERCLDIHNAVPQLKAVFDPANFVQCGQIPLEAWKKLSGYVKYLHIKDAAADGQIVPAGMGVGCIPQIISEYAQKGGDVITLEPHLAVFEGLKDLEQEGGTSDVGRFRYASNDEAFDAGCKALKSILCAK